MPPLTQKINTFIGRDICKNAAQHLVCAEPQPDLMSHLAYFDTTLAESIVQVGLPGNFGDLSMVVLTARNSIGEVAQVSIVLPTNLHVAQLQQTWLKLQDEMAVISSNSTHIFVKVNSHSIHLYHPDLLLDAIRQVVEKTC